MTGPNVLRLVLAAFALWIGWRALALEYDAGYFPLFASAGTLVFLAAEAIAARRQAAGGHAVPVHRFGRLLAYLLGYVGLMALVGFYVSSGALLLLLPRHLGMQNRRTIVLSGALTLVLAWVIFDFLLSVRLPRGLFL